MTTATGMARIVKSGSMPPFDSRCESRQAKKTCGAQAWIFVEFEGGATLPFCVHDYTANEDRLVLAAVRIIDHREALERLEKKD